MANTFYLDASALAKRYIPEPGSALVDAILDVVPQERLRVLNVSFGEVVPVLVRRRNAGHISQDAFEQALTNFKTEIAHATEVRVSVTSYLVTSSFPLITSHSINATDALILKSALAVARRVRRGGYDLVLVASDRRLLQAARAEGLTTFDPETQGQTVLTELVGP